MKAIVLAASFLASPVLSHAAELQPLDSKVMRPGYCFAGSRRDTNAIGGYWAADNSPKKLGDGQFGIAGKISLVADVTNQMRFDPSSRGFRLLLINRSKSEAAFEASDSRVMIVQEALDLRGKWRPIEYLRPSNCGNSYHRVFLPAGSYWEFAAPEYVGTQKTKLRFVLQGKRPIYSNEFEGSINPAQFVHH